jgi:hypothetical protein
MCFFPGLPLENANFNLLSLQSELNSSTKLREKLQQSDENTFARISPPLQRVGKKICPEAAKSHLMMRVLCLPWPGLLSSSSLFVIDHIRTVFREHLSI